VKSRVGVIGAGNIGFGLCRNLLKAGFEVMVYDIRPAPLEKLRELGATIASNPGAAARQCPAVFTIVLDFKQTLGVLQGPEGLLENMQTGGCIFVCSTISPADARHLAGLAANKGLRLLDSPVSGGREGAMAGTLSLMIGGDRSAVEEHRAALEAISANIYCLGDVGAGQAAKAVNQILVAVHNVATAEALLLAARSGIDLKQVFNIISTSAGQSWIFEHRAMRMIERDFTPRGVLKILLKDTSIVQDLGESLGLVLPLASVARQMFQAGVNMGLEDEDDAAVVKVIEALAQFSLADAQE
jgi:putative dehydrogenase